MNTHNKQSSILSLIKSSPLYVVTLLLLFQSCIQKPGPANLSGIDPRNPSAPSTPEVPSSPPSQVYGIEILNDQLVISGNFLEGVQNVRLEGPMGQVENFQIESKTNSEILANGLRNFSLLVGAVFSVIITDAHAASTYQIQFTLENGSVTAQKLAQMGAATGQVLKWNGTSWAPSDLGGLTYAGIWNADNNTPSITSGGDQGEFYIVGTAGFRDPNGGADLGQAWNIGDWVIWNDDQNEWDRISSSSTVASFNGRTGPVMPQYGDYVWADIDKTGSSLNDLFDVNSVGATAGQVLMWNGAGWAPGNVEAADGGGGGGVNSVTATAPLFSTGGANPNLVITQAGSASAGFLSAADWNTFNNKENALPTGTVAQFYRANKTLANFADTVRASALTGLTPAAGTVLATDTLIQGFNKLTGNIISVESALATKEDALPTDGDATKFLRGDKTWQVINTDNIAIGDNLFFDEALVMASALTGYTVGTNTAINATDDLLGALGKLQGQINDLTVGAGNFQADGSTPMTGNLQLQNNRVVFGTGPNTISLKGSEDATEPLLFTLPSTYGVAGRALGTDGTGQLTWLAISGESGDPGVVDLFGDVNGTIPNIFINNAAVTTAKIANSNVTTEKIADNAITNAKIAAGANIAQSKIENLTTNLSTINTNISTLSTDLSTLTTQVSTLPTEAFDITAVVAAGDLSGNYPNPTIADNAITNAKIAAGANIAQSKIQNLTTDLAAIDTRIDDLNTDQITQLGGAANKFFSETLVFASQLSTYTLGTNTAITTDDTVLSAFGKLQRQINDLPTGGGSEPTGTAGGELAGTYPNPTIAVGAITNDKIAAGANIAQSKIENLTTDLSAIDTRIDNLNTDQITQLGGATNKFFNETLVLATELTGYTLGANASIAATDTLLVALGKIQRQINEMPAGGGTGDGDFLSDGSIPMTGNLVMQNNRVVFGTAANTTAIRGAATTSAPLEFTLPGNYGTAGYALGTDGTGGLVWVEVTGGGGEIGEGAASGDLTGNYPGPFIKADAVTTTKIINEAVTADKLAANAVTADKILNNSINNSKIAADAEIEQSKIQGLVTALSALDTRIGTVETDLEDIDLSGITTDDIAEGADPTRKYFSDTLVFASTLAGLNAGTNAVIANGDTLKVALEKLQAQISAPTEIGAGVITNAMISGTAAIEQSKILNLTTNLTTLTDNIAAANTRIDDLDADDIEPTATRQYFTQAAVRSTPLTGFSTSAGTVAATDTLIVALGKLQEQINTLDTGGGGSGDFLANGSVPMTGALNMNSNAINNAGTITTTGANSVSTQNLTLRGSTSGTVNLQASASSANYTISLPAVAGTSGQVLTSDGGTGLVWSTPGEIDPEDLVIPDNSITNNMVATGISASKIKREIASITEPVALNTTDHGIVVLSTSTGDVVLPDPATVGAGFEVTITNLKEEEDTPNNTTVYGHDVVATINGSETISLDTKYATVTLITDGSQWYIMRQTGTVAGGDAGGGPPVGPGTGGACPADENYVQIPGNPQLGVSSFCVMKFHAKQSGAQAVTGPAGQPWTEISQMDAKAACQANGAGYDLISNPEWMTIARNIEAQGINWSGGSRGVGKMIKGYTISYLEEGPALEVTNENDPWNGTGVNPATNTELNNYLQRRIFHLSNGQVLWDFSGNVATWVDWTLGGTLGEPPVTCNGIDFSQAPGSGLPLNEENGLSSNTEFSSIGCSEFTNNDFRPEILSYNNATNGIGVFKAWDAGLTGVVRGGAYYHPDFNAGSGIYSISIIPRSFAELEPDEGDPPEEELPFIGFRCVYRP